MAKAVFISFSLGGAWICYEKGITAEQLHAALSTDSGWPIPDCSPTILADRFFGGYPCGMDKNRAHGYLAHGRISWIDETTDLLSAEDRADIAKEIRDGNLDQKLDTSDQFYKE